MHISARATAIVLAGAALVCSLYAAVQAQIPGLPTDITAIRHNSGQPVIPYFEGWIRNADGSFEMVFGYFNRNFVQEFAIPAGADNRLDPGPIDRAQPTYFLPRRQRYVYRVRVPADFGKQELVWSITSNGRTERAYGNLIAQQEITERVIMTNGGFDPGLDDPNRPPSITIAPPPAVRVGVAVNLAASVTDDGLPKPRPVAPEPSAAPGAAPSAFSAQRNSSTNNRTPAGLTLTWLQYGGPAKVTFARTGAIEVVDGQAITAATFTAPGTYKLIASAADPARLSSRTELVVTVPPNRSDSK